MASLEIKKCQKRRDALIRHIENVFKSCNLLGGRLIEAGEIDLGHRLIANGLVHDHSKFYGVEWEYLTDDSKKHTPELFKAALLQHQTINKHHPDAWIGGIRTMDRLYLAEMVCDFHARATEFGNDLRDWIKEKATKRYSMVPQHKVYHEIKDMVDLLLDSAF